MKEAAGWSIDDCKLFKELDERTDEEWIERGICPLCGRKMKQKGYNFGKNYGNRHWECSHCSLNYNLK